MVSTVQSPSGRFIKYMGQRHRQYIKNKEMTIPNEYKALYSLKDKGKILFLVKKKKRKNAKVETGYEQEEIINPVVERQNKNDLQIDKKQYKLTKEIKKNIKKGIYYENKVKPQEVFKGEQRSLKRFYVFDWRKDYFLVSKENLLFISNVIFNTYLEMRTSKSAIYNVKAIFVYGYEDEDDRKYNRRSFVVRGESIKFEDVYEEVQRIIPLSDGYWMSLNFVKTYYFEKPSSLGCNEEKTKKIIKYLQGKPITLYNPKSINNNCIIMCFNYHLNLKGNGKFKPNTVRKKSGIPFGEKIKYSDIRKICDYYNKENELCGFILYDENFIPILHYNCDQTQAFYENGESKIRIVHLYACADHCYNIIKPCKKKCGKCGRVAYNHTSCPIDRQNFYANKKLKQRFVTIKKIKEEPLLDYENKLVYFDLETLQTDFQHEVYAVGWYDNNGYKQEYGRGSMNKFMDYISTVEEKTITAYNGSSFDFYFLMKELLKRGATISGQVFYSTKLMSFEFNFPDKKKNKVFDLCLFTLSSLEKVCKSFKTEFTKSHFEHSKMKSWNDVQLYRDLVEPYLKLDVLSLREVFIKFNDLMYSLEKVNITKFITLSNMAYVLNSRNLKHNIELFNDYDKYTWVHSSMYGGRVHPLKRYSEIKNYDKVVRGEMTYKELLEFEDFIYNADATSLYPSAMKGVELPAFWKWDRLNEKAYVSANFETYYPVGLSEWSENGEEMFKNGYLGCYFVEFEPPKNIRFPYLLRKNEKGGIVHSLEAGSGVYTCADIEGALIAGYKIKFGKCLYWTGKACTGIFDEFVDKYFNMKMIATKEHNPVKRQIAKILLNSLFGKFLQRPHHEKNFIINNYIDFMKFESNHIVKDLDDFDGKLLVKGISKEDIKTKEITKPAQLGVFILSYSKRIMLTYLKEIDPTLTGDLFSYSDTDSIHITAKAYNVLRKKGLINEGEEDRLGFLTNDLPDNSIIIREINLGPKAYYYEYIDENNNVYMYQDGVCKMKGIPKKYLDSSLYEDEINETFGNMFSEKEISFNSLKKVGLKIVKGNEGGYFSISNQTQTRTFNKTFWRGMDLIGNDYYPKHFDFNTLKE